MLRAPSFDVVYGWRKKQEDALRAINQDREVQGLMDETALKRFIMHYQRITEAMLEELPDHADCVISLSDSQKPLNVRWKQPA